MKKIYTYSKGWMVLTVVFCGLVIAGFGYFLFFVDVPDLVQHPSTGRYWAVAAILLIAIALAAYGMLSALKGKFIIEQDRVVLVGAFSIKELALSDIKGFRTDDKYIYIEPVPARQKSLRMTKYFGDSNELISWLDNNYPNLDASEKEELRQQLLNDAAYGDTPQEREQRLEKAKTFSRGINIAGGVISFSLLLAPQHVKYTLALALAAPLIFALALRSYNGLIKIIANRNSPYPSVIWGFIFLIMFLLIKSFAYKIPDNSGIWQPAILAASALFAILVIGNRQFKPVNTGGVVGLVALAALTFAYGYSAVVGVNCVYDTSKAQQYRAVVLGKRIKRGKSTNYYLNLSAWGNYGANKVSVSRSLFDKVDINDEVNIHLYPGKLAIPWFEVAAQ
jgi:hypothetical protein